MTELPATDKPDSSALLRVRHEPAEDTGGAVVHVAGEIDLATADVLVNELTEVETLLRAPEPLVINLTAVTFLASVGLSTLIQCDNRCREAGIALLVVTGNRTVARTITMTGLDTTLTLFDTLTDALTATR